MALRRRRRRMEINAEINVVSLIDVMLLLLVIFMITAPMMQGGVDISLPKAEARPLTSKGGMVVSVNAAGDIFIDDAKMKSIEYFKVAFPAIAKNKAHEGIYLRGDSRVDFGRIVQILAIMKAANVGEIGLVAEPEVVRK